MGATAHGGGPDLAGVGSIIVAAVAVGGAATAGTKRLLVRTRRRRALEDAVFGREKTREDPDAPDGLLSDMTFVKGAVTAIADHVGADLSGLQA